MGKFDIFVGHVIKDPTAGPNLRGKWHMWFPSDFSKGRMEYIAKISGHRFKLSEPPDGRILKNIRYNRQHDFFMKTASGVNILGKTMTVEFDGNDVFHLDIKYRVVEVGSLGGNLYDYALLEFIGTV
jgi:hypothetical protein